MAVNAAGIPLLLQSSSVSLQDLLGVLSPGDSVRGRVVELLPQNQALVSLRGQNVVAQIPAGAALAKGDILALLVTQSAAGDGTAPASLVLRLLSSAPAVAASPAAPSQAGSPGAGAGAAADTAVWEAALSAARLSPNAAHLALAQTSARLGVPLEPATLQSLAQAMDALLASETPSSTATGAGVSAGQGAVRAALVDGLAQVRAAQLAAPGEGSVALAGAARALEASLAAGGAPLPGSGVSAGSLERAIQALVARPAAAQAQALSGLLEGLGPAAASGGESPTAVALAGAGAGPGTVGTDAGLGGGAGAAGLASGPVGSGPAAASTVVAMREALAQWLGPMGQGTGETATGGSTSANLAQGPLALSQALADASSPQAGRLTAANLAQGAQALSQALADASSPQAGRLVAATLVQVPGADPASALQAGSAALAQAADFYAGLPPGTVLSGVHAVRADLAGAGLPAPAADLASLPPTAVADAVAWLNARGLPPQRPLVETVASWLSQDGQAMPQALEAQSAGAALSAATLDAHPALGAALDALGQAIAAAGLDPASAGLAQRLQSWAADQGLTLEHGLSAAPPSAAGPGAAAPPSAAGPPAGLRGALLSLERETAAALQAPGAASPQELASLNAALKSAQTAVRAFNALPLQAQAAPAFDTVHLPLPVWMGGVLGQGHLSVTWRRGRDRGLDDREPVSVAVALDTESLGQVRVHLEVWRSAATARVTAADPAAAAFLARGADALRAGFAENTPFTLRSLEFAVGPSAPSPGAADAPRPRGAGLSLSA